MLGLDNLSQSRLATPGATLALSPALKDVLPDRGLHQGSASDGFPCRGAHVHAHVAVRGHHPGQLRLDRGLSAVRGLGLRGLGEVQESLNPKP